MNNSITKRSITERSCMGAEEAPQKKPARNGEKPSREKAEQKRHQGKPIFEDHTDHSGRKTPPRQRKTQRNKIVTPLSQRSNIKTRNLQPKSKGRWPATDPTPSCANNDTTQNNGNENKRKWDTPTASSSPPP